MQEGKKKLSIKGDGSDVSASADILYTPNHYMLSWLGPGSVTINKF